jgi:hypothetical protein
MDRLSRETEDRRPKRKEHDPTSCMQVYRKVASYRVVSRCIQVDDFKTDDRRPAEMHANLPESRIELVD